MAINGLIVHLKNCRLVCAHQNINFNFRGSCYELNFVSDSFDTGKGVVVNNTEKMEIEEDVLLWLSVYFGEDFLDPYQQMDTRTCNNRGDFKVSKESIDRFMYRAEKMPPKSYPKWKKRLFDTAITYYSVALRSGLNMMPLTIGFFAMTLECIGNLRHGNSVQYRMLGEKRFAELLSTRLKRYKKSTKHRDSVKAFQKYVSNDISLIHIIRNAYYGHSFLHLKETRLELSEALRSWYLRSGSSEKDAAFFVRKDRIDMDMAFASNGLYKVGLRTTRLFLFMLVGLTRDIPFASHDYSPFRDLRDGEPMHYRGKTMTISTITAQSTEPAVNAAQSVD